MKVRFEIGDPIEVMVVKKPSPTDRNRALSIADPYYDFEWVPAAVVTAGDFGGPIGVAFNGGDRRMIPGGLGLYRKPKVK